MLISRFPYVENSLHYNFAGFSVNFIKQFVSCIFWCLKQMLLSKCVPYCLHYTYEEYCISYHGSVDILCRQNHGIPKIRVYLISRFYWNCENLMLAKYTCFTVLQKRCIFIHNVINLSSKCNNCIAKHFDTCSVQ